PGVDVGADLDARKPQLPNAAVQLAQREIGGLQRERPETDEAAGVLAAERSDGIVQQPGQVVAALRRELIGEQSWDGRQHLDAHAGLVALPQPLRRIPAVARDLAKDRSVLAQHASPALADAL